MHAHYQFLFEYKDQLISEWLFDAFLKISGWNQDEVFILILPSFYTCFLEIHFLQFFFIKIEIKSG